MDLEKRFMESASIIKNRNTDISNDDLLHLYGLYKHGTIGNCDLGNQPWTMFKEERARWNAWYKNYNMIKSDAMQKYIDKVNELMNQNDT